MTASSCLSASASVSASASAPDEARTYMRLCAAYNEKPVLSLNFGEIKCVFVRAIPSDLTQRTREIVFAYIKCRMCANAAATLIQYSSLDGSPLFFTEELLKFIAEDDPSFSFYKEMIEITKAALKFPIVNLEIVTPVMIGSKTSGGFDHWAPNITPVISLNGKNMPFYQAAIDRYIKDPMLERLISNLLSQEGGIDGAIASLSLMDACCKKAPYGDTFLGTVNWLLEFLTVLKTSFGGRSLDQISPIEKFTLLGQLLFKGRLTLDFHGTTCTSFHQANNNVIDLMQTAKSEEAMIKLLTERLDPTKYLRRDETKVLSDKQIDQTMKILGDFEHRMMTHDKLATLPRVVVLTEKKTSSSLSAFEKMKLEKSAGGGASASASASASGGGGFAARCGKSNLTTTITKIKTVEQLCDFLRVHPDTELEIQVESGYPVKLVDSTLIGKTDDEGVPLLKVPFVWGFSSNSILQVYKLAGYQKVSHVLPMWDISSEYKKYQNVYFGIKVSYVDFPGVCTFPEFLSDKYLRVLGPAFEKLHNTMEMILPEGPLAYGIGNTASDRDHTLMKPLNLKVDGVPLKLTKLR
jgi:hypothetical protein